MQPLLDAISWIASHWSDIMQSVKVIGEAVAAIIGAATAIVRLTPTLKDDSIWLPFVKWVSKYIALNDNRDHDAIRSEIQ